MSQFFMYRCTAAIVGMHMWRTYFQVRITYRWVSYSSTQMNRTAVLSCVHHTYSSSTTYTIKCWKGVPCWVGGWCVSFSFNAAKSLRIPPCCLCTYVREKLSRGGLTPALAQHMRVYRGCSENVTVLPRGTSKYRVHMQLHAPFQHVCSSCRLSDLLASHS